MSTPLESIDDALLDTHTDSSNYDPATLWIRAYNKVYEEVINDIVTYVKEDFFWDFVRTDSVIWQSELDIRKIQADIVQDLPELDIKKVNKLFVKYDIDDEFYTRAKYRPPDFLEDDLDFYSENQSESSPFFYNQNTSVFIYPAPTQVIENAFKMMVIYQPAKLTIDSSEDDVKIQKDKHSVFSLWIQEYIFKSQNKTNDAINARNEFNLAKWRLITYLKSKVNQPKEKTKTNLDDYR